MATTDEVVDTYLQTRSYNETATIHGLSYDAVRKRVKRNLPPGSTTHIKEGSIIQQWLKQPKGGVDGAEVAALVHDTLKSFKPPTPLKTPLRGNADFLTLWPLPDLHMGLRSWAPETGKDWEIGIAGKCYKRALQSLGSTLPKSKKALILGIGDLLHSDHYHAGTSNQNTHHVVDVDGRYPKMFMEAAEIVIYAASIARQTADEVEIVILRGNHDEASTIGIELALHYYFRNDKKVKVTLNPAKHYCGEWGKCMIFGTHGDTLKFPKIAGYASASHSEAWGRTKHRFGFSGHFHNERVQEQPGMIVEILQSPSAPDAWTTEMGFCSGRSMQARILSKERGEIARFKEPV